MSKLCFRLRDCTPRVRRREFPPVLPFSFADLLHRARMPSVLEHPCNSCLSEIEALSAQPRTASSCPIVVFWFTVQKACIVLGWKRGQRRKCAATSGHCSLSRQMSVPQHLFDLVHAQQCRSNNLTTCTSSLLCSKVLDALFCRHGHLH